MWKFPKNKSHLKELQDNINIFPSEISGFVEQCEKSIRSYLTYAAVPVAVIVMIASALFWKAVDLASIYRSVEDPNIWVTLVSMSPFVFISVAIIAACYKIARVFIVEIVRISQQRLNLSAISIIATVVSDASGYGLDLVGTELYEKRTRLKMELLREHLKGYIPDDYSYREQVPSANLPNNISAIELEAEDVSGDDGDASKDAG